VRVQTVMLAIIQCPQAIPFPHIPSPPWGVRLGRKRQRTAPCSVSYSSRQTYTLVIILRPRAIQCLRTTSPQWGVRLGRKVQGWAPSPDSERDLCNKPESEAMCSLAPLLPNGEFGWGGKCRGGLFSPPSVPRSSQTPWGCTRARKQ
jgi:hypothetical protein